MYAYVREIDTTLSPMSKVWVYQADRILTEKEKIEITDFFHLFTTRWKTHGVPVKSYFHLFFECFFVFIADDAIPVSGCATDALLREIKYIDSVYSLSLFDRTRMAIVAHSDIHFLSLSELLIGVSCQKIDKNTLFFDNSVSVLSDFLMHWIRPVQNSWLEKKAAN